MKKEIHKITGAVILTSVLFFNSCRSTDTENILTTGGVTAVNFNLLGSEYSNNGNLSPSASLASGKTMVSNGIQKQSFLINPSNVITAELAPSTDGSKVSAQASSGMNSISAVSGNSLTSGTKFRIIAYRGDDGSYQAYQDYTVGQPAVAMNLEVGVNYNLVVYSWGINTLPDINSEEQGNIGTASLSYDYYANPDFMYKKIAFTPIAGGNTVNVTLVHQVAQITTILNSVGLGNFDNNTISNSLSPNDGTAKFSFGTGVFSDRTLGLPVQQDFTGANSPVLTSTPVFINADTEGNAMGRFSADVSIGGVTKTIDLPNSFKITPGNKSTLTINLRKCGAFLGPGNSNWIDFMCHNLGADTSKDPFVPAAAVHGAKYQWGATTGEANKYYSQADDQSNAGIIPGWNLTIAPSNSWLDASKGANDPCPDGYKVPTRAQWANFFNYGKLEKIGSWADNTNNYTTVVYARDESNNRTLMLPVAGYRNYYTNGQLAFRGVYLHYWSSTLQQAGVGYALEIVQGNSINGYVNLNTTYGMPVRCVKYTAPPVV
ncbi:FISUMP domain-containing protein [Elizabethkingia anophelis]|uniref:FISUMP domain-containing protein n=1 Tax=Elizabethkingia anophelis TaxID=1117645 RepID=UPI00320B256F